MCVGYVYFFNTTTTESTWKRPIISNTIDSSIVNNEVHSLVHALDVEVPEVHNTTFIHIYFATCKCRNPLIL